MHILCSIHIIHMLMFFFHKNRIAKASAPWQKKEAKWRTRCTFLSKLIHCSFLYIIHTLVYTIQYTYQRMFSSGTSQLSFSHLLEKRAPFWMCTLQICSFKDFSGIRSNLQLQKFFRKTTSQTEVQYRKLESKVEHFYLGWWKFFETFNVCFKNIYLTTCIGYMINFDVLLSFAALLSCTKVKK